MGPRVKPIKRKINKLEQNLESNWKAAYRSYYIHPKKSDKLEYKLRIRQGFNSEKLSFSNDLHDALSHKSGHDFWNSWRSKFGTANKQTHQINGLLNERDVANKFANFLNKRALSIPNCVILN